MERQRQIDELAALLDGEVRDLQQVEELGALMRVDGVLKAEYEAQRDVKGLLGQLPQAEAPQFMATRIAGEIAARRKVGRGLAFKLAWAGAGGFGVAIVGIISALQFVGSSPLSTAPMLAKSKTAVAPGVTMVTDAIYEEQNWTASTPENLDPQAREYLQFASQAHGFALRRHQAGSAAPDMVEALQVLDHGNTAQEAGQ